MFETFVYFIFGSVNLAYYLAHANGKKYIRLFSAFALYVLSFTTFLTYAGILEHQDTWFKVVSLLPVLDAIVDWRGKVKRGM